MSIPALFTSIENAFQGLSDDLNIDQVVIDDVKKKLQHAAEQMGNSRFPDVHVGGSSFGSSRTAADLGFHHTKAHQVITDTLEGVLADLERFHQGIQTAERLVEEADSTSASDLNRKKQAAEVLVTASSHSDGDERNQQSRNENLQGPTETVTP
jgi:hypothetical protein